MGRNTHSEGSFILASVCCSLRCSGLVCWIGSACALVPYTYQYALDGSGSLSRC